MTTEANITAKTIGVDDKWLYKAGGIFAFAVGLLFIVDLALYISAGKLPSTGAAWLPYVDGKTGVLWAIISVTLISDLLFLIVNVALYAALRTVNRGLMLIATVWASLSIVLDEAVTNSNTGSLITLGGHYATATSAAQRAADVAAANYGASILSSRLDTVYSAGVPAVALVLIGIVMLRSPFGKRIAYLGIVAGAFGLLSISGWSLAVLLDTVLEAIWLMLVGRCLFVRYAAAAVAATPASVAPASVAAAEVSEEIVSI